MLSGGSFRLLRIAGIDVRIHVSWLIIFALVTWSLATSYFPAVLEGLGQGEAWLLGALSSILLFASVLVHELAHSLVARARGLGTHSITLFIFGGVSSLTADSPRPSTEFVISVVGPLSSFVIAALGYLVTSALPDGSRGEAVFAYLTLINLLLGLFNLIPGFPLDGGRVLRAIAWSVTKSRRRGLEIAVAAGQLVSYGFMLWGFVRVLSDDVFGGIWIAVIGWFLNGAASSALQQERLERRLRDAKVGDIFVRDSSSVSPSTSVEELIDDFLVPRNRRAMPVCESDRLVGIVTLGDIQAVARDQRSSVTVGSVMGGRDGLSTVDPETGLSKAIEAMAKGDFEQLPVLEDGHLVGVLTRADVVHQLQLREALDLGPAEEPETQP